MCVKRARMGIVIALVVFFVLCLIWMLWEDKPTARGWNDWERGLVTGVVVSEVGEDLFDE